MGKDFVLEIENFIFDYYKNNAPAENVYHSLTHVKNVVKLVQEIGKNVNLTDDEIELLVISAWFHDIGHIKTWKGHEEISAEFAKKYLAEKKYPAEKIKKIADCILATRMPHQPEDLLEEIICDADIAHIGSGDFSDQSELLKLEIEKRENKKISELNWLEKNIDFLSKNKFFTKYAKLKFEEKKNSNLLKLKKKYRKKIEKKSKKKVSDEKFKLEKEKFAEKSVSSKKADRGIETMFRNVMRTHVSFSSMADSKANIMISVNTLLLGAVFTILIRKLDTNPQLILPTIVLTVVSLITLIMAVKVTRPSISSGLFTKDDIKNKNVNLLFFGNFYKMNLKDFNFGMQEMMEDKNFLYESMIKDFYYLGQVLGKKYKLLRLCYTIFMYGITLSAILFALSVWMFPNSQGINNLID